MSLFTVLSVPAESDDYTSSDDSDDNDDSDVDSETELDRAAKEIVCALRALPSAND